jgi:hypothetical protein
VPTRAMLPRVPRDGLRRVDRGIGDLSIVEHRSDPSASEAA